jgi:hypothetical protein
METKKEPASVNRRDVRCYIKRLSEQNIKISILDLGAGKALVINTATWGFPYFIKEYGPLNNPIFPGRHLGRRVEAYELLSAYWRIFECLKESGRLTQAMCEELAGGDLLQKFSGKWPA